LNLRLPPCEDATTLFYNNLHRLTGAANYLQALVNQIPIGLGVGPGTVLKSSKTRLDHMDVLTEKGTAGSCDSRGEPQRVPKSCLRAFGAGNVMLDPAFLDEFPAEKWL
jgi:hypothetical protein